MKKIVPGVYSVLLTPLKDGGIDGKSFKYTVSQLIDKNIHGLVVIGSTGELPYLTMDEKKEAIDSVMDAAGGKVPVVAGAGAFGTDETIAIARHAEKSNIDALLVPLPIYFELKFESVLAHYERIADSVSLPIIYYHFPEVTHLDLTPDQLARIFEIENVIGIKESIFNLQTIKKHKEALPRDAMIFSGTILMLGSVVKMGGQGCICPIPNLVPEISVAFYEALKKKDGRKAEELEKKLYGLLPVFTDVPLPADAMRRVMKLGSKVGLPMKMGSSPHAALKEASRLLGHPITPEVKPPLPPLTEKQKKRIKKTLEKMNLLKEQA
ncbi:MAG: dihydrodipicolinate synthase family protein [bacterium]